MPSPVTKMITAVRTGAAACQQLKPTAEDGEISWETSLWSQTQFQVQALNLSLRLNWLKDITNRCKGKAEPKPCAKKERIRLISVGHTIYTKNGSYFKIRLLGITHPNPDAFDVSSILYVRIFAFQKDNLLI